MLETLRLTCRLRLVYRTGFAVGVGAVSTSALAAAGADVPTWLVPASIASIGFGIALLLLAWLQSRRLKTWAAASVTAAVAEPDRPQSAPAEDLATKFCTECGARNSTGRKFCNQCGHSLN